jgi:hypothetical protein
MSMIGRAYAIELEHATLRWKESSPQSPGIDYKVDLVGGPDRNWRKTFYLAQRNFLGKFLFQLRENGQTVEFHCGPDHGFARAELLFGALETLVRLVNRDATRRPSVFAAVDPENEAVAVGA